jgi:urease accessory protein
LCQKIIRVIADFDDADGAFDLLDIQWPEHGGRALRGQTRGGRPLRIILPADQSLEHGSVLRDEEGEAIAVNLLPCLAMVICPATPHELATISYAIGNLHLPAEIGAEEILIPASESTQAAVGRAGIPFDLDMRRVRTRRDDLPRVQLSSEFQRR